MPEPELTDAILAYVTDELEAALELASAAGATEGFRALAEHCQRAAILARAGALLRPRPERP